MNPIQLDRIVLRGYKSIRECDLELKNLNVLVGPNGAGKSSFIGFLCMMMELFEKNLQHYVAMQGGADLLLHFGKRNSESISAELYFGPYGYKCSLRPNLQDRLLFSPETLWWESEGDLHVGSDHCETVAEDADKTELKRHVIHAIKQWRAYHFHDTGETAPIKRMHGINDNLYLRPDAGNLAPFLYLLKHNHHPYYEGIVKIIQQVAPFFGEFLLRPHQENPSMIQLEWVEKYQKFPFPASAISDGTLRFICLVTALMQPEEFCPSAIIIDEPELGLHPYAISVLGGLLRSASKTCQVIIATQSATLLDEFDPEDVITANMTDGLTTFERRTSSSLKEWLEDYSLGELWRKNVLGGGPAE